MARPRKFNEGDVLSSAMALFARRGFTATSLDDLVDATGLLRGSIYKAFGSKLNIFLTGFTECVEQFDTTNPQHLDLLTVALRDLAHEDESTRKLCLQVLSAHTTSLALNLGNNLLQRLE
ncbi:MAG: helix-turn-helix domain-containing protein [Aurantimicrobium sp.]